MRPRSTSARRRAGRCRPDGAGRDQFLGEERVALGTGQDPVDHGRRDRLAGDGPEVLGQLGPAEGEELDPLQVGEADQLGQQRPQGWRCSSSCGSWPPGRPGPPRRVRIRKPAGRGWRRSAQWRSSITSSSGASSDRRTSSDSTPSNSWTRSKPSPGGDADPWSVASSSSRPRLGTAAASGAVTAASLRAGAEVTEGVDEGHIGEADVADLHAAADQHPDAAAGGPAASSSSSRVLPTPASRRSARRPAPLGPVEQGEQAVELFGPADEAPAVVEVTPESMALRRQRGTPASHLRDPAALHHEGDVGQQRQVVERVAGTAITSASGRGRGRRPGPASRAARRRPRWPTGWRPSGSSRGGPCRAAAGVPAVRVDAAVGAVGDPHAGLDRRGEAVALGLGGGFVLGQRLRRPALLAPSAAM